MLPDNARDGSVWGIHSLAGCVASLWQPSGFHAGYVCLEVSVPGVPTVLAKLGMHALRQYGLTCSVIMKLLFVAIQQHPAQVLYDMHLRAVGLGCSAILGCMVNCLFRSTLFRSTCLVAPGPQPESKAWPKLSTQSVGAVQQPKKTKWLMWLRLWYVRIA